MKFFTKLNENPQTKEDYIKLLQVVFNHGFNSIAAAKIVDDKIKGLLLSVPNTTNKQELEDMFETVCIIYDAACKSSLSLEEFNELVYQLEIVKTSIREQIGMC